MFQVTAIFEGCEVGYGEGDGLAYAIEECIDSIDSFYRQVMRDMQFRAIGGRFPVTMDIYSARSISQSTPY